MNNFGEARRLVSQILEKTMEANRRTGRPTLQDASRRSERLMAVATDYFVEHGFNGTTIDAIAQAADMGKQAVYTRFTDKERLFNAVIQRLKEKAVFTALPCDDGSPVAEGLPRRIRAIFEDANRPYAMTVSKLALREGRRFPELVPLLLEGTAERFTRPLAAYLEARKAAGDVRDRRHDGGGRHVRRPDPGRDHPVDLHRHRHFPGADRRLHRKDR